jgi:SAM-dependent methyltransferase
MPLDKYRSANRASWDEMVPIHVRSEFYDVDGFRAGESSLKRIDVEEVGDVRGKSLLHLQCHFGLDTLSWARLGATVTGIDFSGKAVEAARALGRETGIPGRFIECELYDAPAVVDERFDIVYTGLGALCWLPDIHRWAAVVAHFLKPGGTFYIREAHPVLWSLDEAGTKGALEITQPYFEVVQPMRFDDGSDYADPEASLENRVTYEWNHGLGEIVTSLIEAGLRIELVREHRECDWRHMPQMVKGADGFWRLPEKPERLPLMYSIRAFRER